MILSEFKEERYEVSFIAGMNQRYHQTMASWWMLWNRITQIVVGVLAVASACLSAGAISSDSLGLDIAALIVSASAAVAAVALNVLPFGDWSQRLSRPFSTLERLARGYRCTSIRS